MNSSLDERIAILEKKISYLEEFYICHLCKEIQILINCHNCRKKTCNGCYNSCETKSRTGETIFIHFCKECQY